jgi:hypothetical protein
VELYLHATICLHGLVKKGKVVPVAGREGPQSCEMSRLPYFLDNRLTDGGEVVSLTRTPLFYHQMIPGAYFC